MKEYAYKNPCYINCGVNTYVRTYIYIHIHKHAYIHTYIHTYDRDKHAYVLSLESTANKAVIVMIKVPASSSRTASQQLAEKFRK